MMARVSNERSPLFHISLFMTSLSISAGVSSTGLSLFPRLLNKCSAVLAGDCGREGKPLSREHP